MTTEGRSGARWPFRVTPPLLDVVEALVLTADAVHGWALAERARCTRPNVYRALRRLRQAGWVGHEWEQRDPATSTPPRRLYWLTPEGREHGQALLAERRPTRNCTESDGSGLPAGGDMPFE